MADCCKGIIGNLLWGACLICKHARSGGGCDIEDDYNDRIRFENDLVYCDWFEEDPNA